VKDASSEVAGTGPNSDQHSRPDSGTNSRSTQSQREQTWAERLFREEDSFPHKNIAYCRDEFRVCLVSQLAVSDLDEYLFGSEWGGLPSKDLFQILIVNTEDEDGEKEANDYK
jgi:hypothetical protein